MHNPGTRAEVSQDLKDWIERLPLTFYPPEAHLAVRWFLARELDSQGLADEALAMREQIVANRSQTFAGGGVLWQKSALELVRSYQELGRLEEANNLLSDLQAMWQWADPDHPLLKQQKDSTDLWTSQ